MPFADAGGFRLHYVLEGDAAKPVIVLSNSLGSDLSMWDPQREALLSRFRVLRYDTRGHGRSEMPNDAYTPCTLAVLGGDVITLLDHLEIEHAAVCGVSLGGLTAMWLAVHAASRVTALVLSNTAAKIGSADTWNQRIAAVQQGGLAAIADTVPSRWFTSAYQVGSSALADAKAMLLRCSAEGYTACCAALRDADLRPEIAAITAPTLVLSGAEDHVTPPSDGRALQAGILGALFREVPGAHLSNIENPGAYNAALLPFLHQHTAGGPHA